MMIKVYPAIFEKYDKGYSVSFPDVENAVTQGKDVADTFEMASDALGIQLSWYVENDEPLPTPQDISNLEVSKGQFASLVSVDLSEYLEMNEPVKKTLQIPKWADKRGHELGLNFSKTLTEAILEKSGG